MSTSAKEGLILFLVGASFVVVMPWAMHASRNANEPRVPPATVESTIAPETRPAPDRSPATSTVRTDAVEPAGDGR